jgi:RecA/RadA recombinase
MTTKGGIDMAARMDREKAMEQAISQIERQFGRGSIMKMGEERVLDIPAISTGSLALDLALGIPLHFILRRRLRPGAVW